MTVPSKAPVVGVPISTTTYDEVFDAIDARPSDRAMVIAVCNVHSVMSARSDAALAAAIGRSSIATPDGVPVVWALRLTANSDQQRVYGPEIMRRALVEQTDRQWRHYLYGSTDETLAKLTGAIADIAPDAVIVGQQAPPFRPLTEQERRDHLAAIRDSDADIVWVGLGMPKQELWMDEISDDLPGVAVIGVGAAFDFLAGTVKQAPAWMQRSGLEWLYRLLQEPRRLWRRYIWNNPAYVILVARQVVAGRLANRRNGDPNSG